jgi:hypothetical protein
VNDFSVEEEEQLNILSSSIDFFAIHAIARYLACVGTLVLSALAIWGTMALGNFIYERFGSIGGLPYYTILIIAILYNLVATNRYIASLSEGVSSSMDIAKAYALVMTRWATVLRPFFLCISLSSIVAYLFICSQIFRICYVQFQGFSAPGTSFWDWVPFAFYWAVSIITFNASDILGIPITTIHPTALWSQILVILSNVLLSVVIVQNLVSTYQAGRKHINWFEEQVRKRRVQEQSSTQDMTA